LQAIFRYLPVFNFLRRISYFDCIQAGAGCCAETDLKKNSGVRKDRQRDKAIVNALPDMIFYY